VRETHNRTHSADGRFNVHQRSADRERTLPFSDLGGATKDIWGSITNCAHGFEASNVGIVARLARVADADNRITETSLVEIFC